MPNPSRSSGLAILLNGKKSGNNQETKDLQRKFVIQSSRGKFGIFITKTATESDTVSVRNGRTETWSQGVSAVQSSTWGDRAALTVQRK